MTDRGGLQAAAQALDMLPGPAAAFLAKAARLGADGLGQGLTLPGVADAMAEGVRRATDDVPTLELPPLYAQIALKDLGEVKEIPGPRAHPRIEAAQALTRYREPDGDETPWCSAIMCLWMDEGGQPHTASAAARSWLEWGQPAPEPWPLWSVVVLWRGRRDGRAGHVGLLMDIDRDAGRVKLLGGNQGNAVTEKWYSATRVLDVRVPKR